MVVPFDMAQNPQIQRTEAVTFRAVSQLTVPRGAQVTVRGARIADPKQWPASYYSSGGAACSSNLVGSRTLLTAAHCVADRGNVSIVAPDGTIMSAECERSPDYNPGAEGEADVALCYFSTDVRASKFESVNSDPSLTTTGVALHLTGFGCTNADGTGNDGIFREGDALVQPPQGNGTSLVVKGGASLCYGDSGGGTFIWRDATHKGRIQVAVNAAAQRDALGLLTQTSYLTGLAAPVVQQFVRSWAKRHQASICGMDNALTVCQ